MSTPKERPILVKLRRNARSIEQAEARLRELVEERDALWREARTGPREERVRVVEVAAIYKVHHSRIGQVARTSDGEQS